MRFVEPRPFADPEAAARKLLEIANSVEPVQDGRIHIEKLNWPFLAEFKGSPAEYSAGLKLAIERGWIWMLCEVHPSRRRLVHLINRSKPDQSLKKTAVIHRSSSAQFHM
jgi:hypothetical protein